MFDWQRAEGTPVLPASHCLLQEVNGEIIMNFGYFPPPVVAEEDFEERLREPVRPSHTVRVVMRKATAERLAHTILSDDD